MAIRGRWLAMFPVVPVAGAAFVLSQVLRAAHRSDLPSFPNQDPSGVFGDPRDPPVRIVALGDSSITAPGVESLDNVWIRSLAIDLADQGRRVELIALAVGGSKAHDVIEGQLPEAMRLRPDVAVVSVGSNDALRGVPRAQYRARLTHIVGSLSDAAGAVLIVGMGDLGSVPRLPPSIRPYCTMRSHAFDDVATEVAASFPTAVKVYTRNRMTTAFWEDRSLFAGDLFHAGDTGHQLFAEEIGPAFRAALSIALDGDRPGPRT